MTSAELRSEAIRTIWKSRSTRRVSISSVVLQAAGLGTIVWHKNAEGKIVGASTNLPALTNWLAGFPFKVWADLDHERGMIHIQRI